MNKADKKEFRESDWEELLKEALLKWTKEANIDPTDPSGPFYKINQDPIVKLLMMALSHETNKLNDEISMFRENLVDEIIGRVIPAGQVHPVPSFTVIQTSKVKGVRNEVYANAETPFIIERDVESTKPNIRTKTKEKITFIPLLKTRIVDARIGTIENRGLNKYLVRLECGELLRDLSGISFYIANKEFSDLVVTLDGKPLPLIRPDDFDKLPFTEWFNMESCLFEKSLAYGTTEYWKDIVIASHTRFYTIDTYDTRNISLERFGHRIDLEFEFTSSGNDFRIDSNDIEINCIPAVNVEKNSVRLSGHDPIKKIGEEEYETLSAERADTVFAPCQKQFIHLVAGSTPECDKESFVLRRFGIERFNRKELLLQVKSIVNRFRSDYYAYLENEGLRDGEKMKQLSMALNEVFDEVRKEGEPTNGIYLILTKRDSDPARQDPIQVSYLVTDGSRVNGIKPDASIKPVSGEFDKNSTRLLRVTQGGRDFLMNKDQKRRIVQYNVLTRDRLFTKSDIRFFCYKELQTGYSIEKNSVSAMQVTNKSETVSRETTRFLEVFIGLKQVPDFIVNNDFSQMEDRLKKMIEIRSMNLYPIRVRVTAG
jgi:hypothetical protein